VTAFRSFNNNTGKRVLDLLETKCARYPMWKKFAPRKSRPKFTVGPQIFCYQSIGRARGSIDTL